MAVAFVAAGAPSQSANTAKPTGVADGDMMIAFTATREVSTWDSGAAPGWTRIVQVDSSGLGASSSIIAFWKVAEASDPASWGLGPSSLNLNRGIILAYSGVDTSTPIDAYATANGTGETVSWSTVTAAGSTFIVGGLAHVTAGTSVTDPTGVTRRWAPLSASGGEAQGYGWDKSVAAGASGAFSTTFPGAGDSAWGSITLALRLAALPLSPPPLYIPFKDRLRHHAA